MYDSAAKDGRKFDGLSPEAKTVMLSVMHQYGKEGIRSKTPDFWRQMTQGLWNEAEANLMNFNDEHETRRRSEAALFRRSREFQSTGNE